MDATTQWREEDGDSSHTFFEAGGQLSPPCNQHAITRDVYPETTSSMFGSVECGEPLVSQHLVVDFQLRDDPEAEELQQKVRDFWEFLDTHPELDDLVCVEEEQAEPTPETISSVTPTLMFSDDEAEPLEHQTTALSTLCLYDTAASSSIDDVRATLSGEELGRLHKDLCAWDQRHPKSMEGPGHPPSLARAKFVRGNDIESRLEDYDETLRNNDPYNY